MDSIVKAAEPEDLARMFVERANAGDVEGLVALYEPDAMLAVGDGGRVQGAAAIRAFYRRLLADRPTFTPADQQPALRNADLALTSTRLVDGGATAEVARRQPDGSWLWILDQPTVV
jgi:ketosteroid isomerase-like protein